jgi:hypothetical protein
MKTGQLISRKNSPFLSFAIGLALLISACQSGSMAQKGKWTASLRPNTKVTWTLVFSVADNGKQISSGAVLDFGGTAVMALQPVDIQGNKFKLTFQSMNGYALETYEFDGTFTSASKATGTVNIRGTPTDWAAAPAAP